MSIDDRGRVFAELLLVAIVFVFAMGRITPWEVRAAGVMNGIEHRQIARDEMPARTVAQLGSAQLATIREKPMTPRRVQDTNVEPRSASRIRAWIASAE